MVLGTTRWSLERKVRDSAPDPASIPSGCPEGRLFVPSALRTMVLNWGHSSRLACHPGLTRTGFLIAQRFWWPSMSSDIRVFVSACPVCASVKTPRTPLPACSTLYLCRPDLGTTLLWTSSLDCQTQGKKTVIIYIIDRFSKLAHAIPLQKLPSAKELAALVSQHLFRLHGLPINIISDRGPQFIASFWKEFCNLLGIKVSLSSGFHPQTNGQVERYNQDLETSLRAMCCKNPKTWSSQLPWVEYSHNSLVNSTGYSPFQAAYGFQHPLFPRQEHLASSSGPAAFLTRCRHTWSRFRQELLRNQEWLT
uniref:Gypsy retrotransposon integrase-like protein 1 n=1 Tax=Oryzias latipes TaxID=8090 RepID=A0A3P9J093_ORYLA